MNPADVLRMKLIQQLLDHLRTELHEYGEMLALLELQQERVMARSADDVLQSVALINAQMERVQQARRRREDCQRELACAVGGTPDAPCGELLPRLPESHQPAVAALVRENNLLLKRIQQRARQNHVLLSRSVELMQRFIAALIPAHPPVTYNGDGLVHTPGAPESPVYQAVG